MYTIPNGRSSFLLLLEKKMNNNVKISYSQYVVDGLLPYGGYVN